MDKGNNKFNKFRNKFNPNQNNPLNFPHNKNIKRNYPMMPYDPNQNPGLIPNEEFPPSAPYPMQTLYPMQMPIPQNKETFLKNAFKAYYLNQKKYNPQYPTQEYMMPPNNEMSMEDNPINGNKKFNDNKKLIKKRKINNYFPNKEFMGYNPNNINENNNDNINNQNKANSSENNNNEFQEYYYNNDFNNFYNYHVPKAGKKKAISQERNINKNRNKKGNRKKDKRKFEDNYNINNKNDNFKKYNNIKDFNNKRINGDDSFSISDLDNNYYSSEEEREKDEENNTDSEQKENSKDKFNKEDKDASDDIIILDNSSKELIDVNKFKLIEKKNFPEKNTNSTDKKKNENKNKIIPLLEQMCSENEIKEREKNRDIDRLEIDSEAFPKKKGDKARMVQKYNWKGGKKLNLNEPNEIRSINAINKSIEYLIEKCLDCDKTNAIKLPEGFEISPMDIIPFIYDRFLAIYKTIELLSENDPSIFDDENLLINIGKMIRTLIIFLNLDLDYCDEENVSKEINNFIDNLLIPLLNIYKDILINESDYKYNLSQESKDEFISYYLFIELKKQRNNFEKLYKEIKSELIPDKTYTYTKIELLNDVYLSLKNKDYQKFISILKNDENCDYFLSCLMSLFFKEINVYGLQKLSLTKKVFTYKEIRNLLTFEDLEEIKDFLVWYGISSEKNRYSPNESDDVNIYMNNPNKKYDYNKAPQKTNIKYVEKKKGEKLRKDMVNKTINFIKNENNEIQILNDVNNNSDTNIINKDKEVSVFKNPSIINSDISQGKSGFNEDKNNIKQIKIKEGDIPPNKNLNIFQKPNIINTEIKSPINTSFISYNSMKELFPKSNNNSQSLTPKTKDKDNSTNIFNKSEDMKKSQDEFLRPLSPKKPSFDMVNNITNNDNKSIDLFSHTSLSSIEPQKNPPNFTEQTLEFFCDVANSAINKIISGLKLDFFYRVKFLAEKYKIKLDLIENYINRRKFFVFNEFKKCCLDKKYAREYLSELLNYKNNINSQNTNENTAFKIENKNIAINKKFELLTYDDIIYFLIKNFKNGNIKINNEQKEYLNHLQINIYTTKDLIKSTKLLSGLKIKKQLIKENEDGTELTIINQNININSEIKNISFIIKFIFVDQIIHLESYIDENHNNIQKYSILIPFFDIIKSDPENQQILTKFFTILDIALGSLIKKDIIFFFIKRDIETTSELYKEYQNIQNDFIFNLMQKYSINSQKNNIINIDENYDSNEEIKKRIIYLSPIDEFGKCYQEYRKYLNNKAFVELFENNNLLHLYSFNQKEILIPFDKHIASMDTIINHYINIIEEDLKKYLELNNNINYFYNKKLCIEILIGFVMCKILLIYYQNKCLIFANELYKIPIYNSNYDLLVLGSNLLDTGSILRQINLEGYDYIWEKCMNLDIDKAKNVFSYYDIFSEMICSYNLISDIDIQNYEFAFRKQYYAIGIEKKNYELATNFVNYFNKIISKYFENNNIKIHLDNTSEIIEKIYNKNKQFLISTIAKIMMNNDNLIFNENLIYVQGLENFYLGLKDKEIAELKNNLNKKRKRKAYLINNMSNMNSINNLNNKKTMMKISKYSKLKENKNQILNNVININESIDKSKDISKSFNSKDNKENGDVSDEYYKYFRNVKKCTLPDGLI
mgnify:FL=1